jgi:aminomethyltransferase
VTRDTAKLGVGQVMYAPWCDEQGKVIDDGTVSRLAENRYRWTAADPSLRWFVQNASGLDVEVEDISERVAALAVQGPMSAALLQEAADADIASLKYYGVTSGRIDNVQVDISRTGYTGDLGYEIWMPWEEGTRVWDALAAAGAAFDLHPAGMIALDIARIEAGLLLVDVDYVGSRKALIPSQQYSPFELGLGRLVSFTKGPFVGRAALERERAKGVPRQIVGLEVDWLEVEALFEKVGLPPQVPATASRVAVPVYQHETQVGKATSTTWSPILKKLIALATVDSAAATIGERLKIEMTVEAVRHQVSATVVKTPFFNPTRKTAKVV